MSDEEVQTFQNAWNPLEPGTTLPAAHLREGLDGQMGADGLWPAPCQGGVTRCWGKRSALRSSKMVSSA